MLVTLLIHNVCRVSVISTGQRARCVSLVGASVPASQTTPAHTVIVVHTATMASQPVNVSLHSFSQKLWNFPESETSE